MGSALHGLPGPCQVHNPTSQFRFLTHCSWSCVLPSLPGSISKHRHTCPFRFLSQVFSSLSELVPKHRCTCLFRLMIHHSWSGGGREVGFAAASLTCIPPKLNTLHIYFFPEFFQAQTSSCGWCLPELCTGASLGYLDLSSPFL